MNEKIIEASRKHWNNCLRCVVDMNRNITMCEAVEANLRWLRQPAHKMKNQIRL